MRLILLLLCLLELSSCSFFTTLVPPRIRIPYDVMQPLNKKDTLEISVTKADLKLGYIRNYVSCYNNLLKKEV